MLPNFDKSAPVTKKFAEFELIFHNKNDLKKIRTNHINKIKHSGYELSKEQVFSIDKFNDSELLEFSKISDEKKLIRYVNSRMAYNNLVNNRITSKFPPLIQIETTSICNFRCIMCYQSDSTFSKKSSGHMGSMSFELYKKIIDESEGNVELITFASRGEPTLNVHFYKMLDYAKDKFVGTKINTNASMLNEKRINEILSSDIQTIVFSVDSATKEEYEKIRVRGNFDQVLNNINMFIRIKEKNYSNSKIISRLSGVKTGQNQKIEDLKKTFGEYVDAVSFVDYTPWEDIYNNSKNNITSSCGELWRRIFIWWDGKVNPCDFDYKSKLSGWNLNEMSIEEIWNSKYYNNLREKHMAGLRKELEPCSRCYSA